MRLNIFCAAMFAALLAVDAQAAINANSGFYVGADFGMMHYARPSGAAIGDSWIPLPDGIVRPIIGYRFNDYAALEAGYNDIENEDRPGNNYWGPDKLRIYSFDLSGKAIFPFQDGISLFGKAGVAWTHQYVYNVVFAGGTPSVDQITNRPQVLAGAGVSYNFTRNFALDLSGSHYFPNGAIGAMDMLALGATYTFGGN